MEIKVRQERKSDHSEVFELIKAAFINVEMSDHSEHFLVERLRASSAFVPELSLVAESDGKIVGHIILSRIQVVNASERHPSLALAPVSVLPSFQGKGIGGQLIRTAHVAAAHAGFGSVILLGHANYYPRFGYQKASGFGIKLPFEVPDENCMAIELQTDSLKEVNGTVEYPTEFFG